MEVRRPKLLGEVGIVVVLLVFYDRVAKALEHHPALGDAHGAALLRGERRLHIDAEHRLNLWLSAHHVPEILATGYYQLMYTTTALAVLLTCYVRRPDLYRTSRNALLLINVAGLAVFVLYPVAPPRSLPGGGFIDSDAAVWPVHYPPDHFGAMPSLHLAWAVWVGVVGIRIVAQPLLRVLLALHPTLTAIAVVTTANHYVLDVVAGAALGVAGTTAAARWTLGPSASVARSVRTVGQHLVVPLVVLLGASACAPDRSTPITDPGQPAALPEGHHARSDG
jgi:hypothetical protein